MIELDENKITEMANKYADSKEGYFKPFLASYRQAIINAYIDAYVAAKTEEQPNFEPFLNIEEIMRE